MNLIYISLIIWYMITALPLLYLLIITYFTWIWLWVIIVFYLSYIRFGKKFKYLEHPKVLNNEKYFAFTRNDYKNWSLIEFVLVGIFLTPLRIGLFFFYSVPAATFLAIYLNLYKIDPDNLPENLSVTFRIIIKIWSKISLLSSGIYFIKEITIEFDPKKYPKLERDNDLSYGRIFLSNHISFMDILYFFNKYNICTIARSNLKTMPIVGLGGTLANSIFVDRFDSNSRNNAIDALNKRIERNKQTKNQIDILIFPEGTTTNGKAILNFKKGAFSTKAPLYIHFLKYESKVCPSFNLINIFNMIIGTGFTLNNFLTIYKMNCCLKKKNGVSIEEFIEEIRNLYENEFGVKKMDLGFKDKIYFETKYGDTVKNNYK